MSIQRLLLLFVIVGGLVIFALENAAPVVPLVILGTETLALPLAVWLLGAIAAGALTTLVITALAQVPGRRRRSSRFYADRPRYRTQPPNPDADPYGAAPYLDDDDEEDWQVVDVDRDRPKNPSPNRFFNNRFFNRSPDRPTPNRPITNRPTPDRPVDVQDNIGSPPPSSSRFTSKQAVLDDWESFGTPRNDWNDWNTYEEPTSSQRSARVEDSVAYRDTAYREPETVIQDSADSDWKDWGDYETQEYGNGVSREFREEEEDFESAYAERMEPSPTDSDRFYQQEAYVNSSSDSYTSNPHDTYDAYDAYEDEFEDEGGDRYARFVNDEAEDAYQAYEDIDEEVYDDEASPEYWRRDGGDRYRSDYPPQPEVYDSTVDDGDATGYTDYVRYSEEDDYYDDYEDYVGADAGKPAEPIEVERVDIDEFDDWDEKASDSPPNEDHDESGAPVRKIYEVQKPPQSVTRSGTIYSYSYRDPGQSGAGQSESVYDVDDGSDSPTGSSESGEPEGDRRVIIPPPPSPDSNPESNPDASSES